MKKITALVLILSFQILAHVAAAAGPQCSLAPQPAPYHYTPILSVPDPQGNLQPATDVSGNTPFGFHVNDAGNANITIPLSTAPGRQGVEPNLSLNYTSTTHNGLLGVGWALSGLSQIRRDAKNLSTDGVVQGIQFTNNDFFALDGERLINIKGAYGANNTEYRTEGTNYAKIISYTQNGVTGPAYFKVWTRSGLVMEYGSAIDACSSVVQGGALTYVHTWAVKKVSDAFGNTMVYNYGHFAANDAPNNVLANDTVTFWPTSIQYTANTPNNVVANKEVDFEYEDNPDPTISAYLVGVNFSQFKRLKRIASYGPQRQLFREYKLAYDNDSITLRSHLISVTECRDGNICRDPSTFNWTEGRNDYLRWDSNKTIPIADGPIVKGDVNGDGFDDLVYPAGDFWRILPGVRPPLIGIIGDPAEDFSDEITTTVPVNRDQPLGILPFDYNGDGYTDFLSFSGQNFLVFQSTGPNLNFVVQDTHVYRGTNSNDRNTPATTLIADLNGDGLPDLVYRGMLGDTIRFNDGSIGPYSYRAMYYSLMTSPGTYSGARVNSKVPYPILEDEPDINIHTKPPTVFDYNGDGKQEILFSDGAPVNWGGWHYYFASIGQGTDQKISAEAFSLAHFNSDKDYRTLDWNGDGNTDILWFDTLDGGTASIQINTGNSFLASRELFNLAPGSFPSLKEFITIGDYNGDGMSDVFIPNPAVQDLPLPEDEKWVVFVSNGDTLPGDPIADTVVTDIPFDISLFNRTGGMPTHADLNPIVMDFNGDGLDDFFQVFGPDHFIVESQHKEGAPDLIVGLTDGFGNAFEVSYSPFNWETTRTANLNYTFPLKPYIHNRPIVSESRARVGNQWDPVNLVNMNLTRYAYYDPLVDVRGRGFVGFRTRTVELFGENKLSTYNYAQYNVRKQLNADASQANNVFYFYPLAWKETSINHELEALPNNKKFETQTFSYTNTINSFSNTIGATTYTAKNYQTYLASVTNEYFDALVNGASLGKFVNLFTLDTYGNKTSEKQSWINSVGTVQLENLKTNTYLTNAATWKVDLPNTLISKSTSNAENSLFTTKFFYQADKTLKQKMEFANNAINAIFTDFTFDTFGNIISVINFDSSGVKKINSLIYTANGDFPLCAINALNQEQDYEYDSTYGFLTKATESNGRTTFYTYDGFGRLRTLYFPDGNIKHFSYAQNDANYPYSLSTWDQTSGVTTQYFDYKGRNARTEAAGYNSIADDDRIVEEIQFNNIDQITTQYLAQKKSQINQLANPHAVGALVRPQQIFAYDTLGRVTKIQNADQTSKTFAYQGLKTTVTDEKGNSSNFTSNAAKQVVETNDALNGKTTYKFGPFGFIRKVTDSANHVTEIVYDALMRRSQVKDPDLGTWNYTRYSPYGELLEMKDAKLQVISYGYDLLGRRTKRTTPDGVTSWDYDNAANGIGYLSKMTTPDNTITEFTYNNKGQKTSTKLTYAGAAYTTQFGYDNNSRLQAITYPDPLGFTINYNYDGLGHLSSITEPFWGTVIWELKNVSPEGNILQATYGNNVDSNRTYFYGNNRAKTIQDSIPNGGTITNFEYAYDNGGNLTARIDRLTNTTEQFTYDKLNRIKTFTNSYTGSNFNYDYDAIGNLTHKSDISANALVYGGRLNAGPHALTKVNAGVYDYDANGNMTSGDGRTIVYTAFNKPSQITINNQITSFRYDGEDERVYKTGPEGGTLYINGYSEFFDAPNLTKTIRNNIYAYGMLVADATRTKVGVGQWGDRQYHYYHQDHLGSTAAITGQNGAVTELMSFEPFGKAQNLAGDANLAIPRVTPGFTGHEHDSDTGLINMGGRMYDPKIGRFTSADPFVQAPKFSQSLNRYSYVWNNPVSRTDPNGFEADGGTLTQTFTPEEEPEENYTEQPPSSETERPENESPAELPNDYFLTTAQAESLPTNMSWGPYNIGGHRCTTDSCRLALDSDAIETPLADPIDLIGGGVTKLAVAGGKFVMKEGSTLLGAIAIKKLATIGTEELVSVEVNATKRFLEIGFGGAPERAIAIARNNPTVQVLAIDGDILGSGGTNIYVDRAVSFFKRFCRKIGEPIDNITFKASMAEELAARTPESMAKVFIFNPSPWTVKEMMTAGYQTLEKGGTMSVVVDTVAGIHLSPEAAAKLFPGAAVKISKSVEDVLTSIPEFNVVENSQLFYYFLEVTKP